MQVISVLFTGPYLPKRIRNIHSRNYYDLKGKDTIHNIIPLLKKENVPLIPTNNAEHHSSKLPKIIGDYKPSYLYETVKIHKPDHPQRLIISQIAIPYELPKTLKHLITPYLPSKYNI